MKLENIPTSPTFENVKAASNDLSGHRDAFQRLLLGSEWIGVRPVLRNIFRQSVAYLLILLFTLQPSAAVVAADRGLANSQPAAEAPATDQAPGYFEQAFNWFSGNTAPAIEAPLPPPPPPTISEAVISRHHPSLNGGTIDGSLRVFSGESYAINSQFHLNGDLYAVGTPNITVNSGASHGGVINDGGTSTPSGYGITLNSGVVMPGKIHIRANPVALPSDIPTSVPNPSGTRTVNINSPADLSTIGNWATLRNLNVNPSNLVINVPPGNYGTFSLNGPNIRLVFSAGTYNFSGTVNLNSGSNIQSNGAVTINIGQNLNLNNGVFGLGAGTVSSDVKLNIVGSSLSVNNNSQVSALVRAANATVNLNAAIIRGHVIANYLNINSGQIIGDANPADTTAPTLAITSPANNSTTPSAAINVTGTVSDGGSGITSVTVNDVAASYNAGAGTWSFANLDLALGSNVITVKATDGAGNITTQTVTVTRQLPPDVTVPSVAITSPANNTTVPAATITVSGTASDSGLGATGINRVMVNGVQAAYNSGTGTWTISGVALNEGANTITAVAYDNAPTPNSSQTSITVTRTTPDTQAPAVAITSPADNTTVPDAAVTVSGTVSDTGLNASGVNRVMVNGVQAAYNSGTGTWTISGVALNEGANTITAIAYDNAPTPNSSQTSITVTRTTPDTQAPTVSVTSPADGSETYGSMATITGIADDEGLNAAGVANVTVNGQAASYDANTHQWTAADVPLVIGDNTITVTVIDGASSPNQVQTVIHIIRQEIPPPTVSITSPANNSATTAENITISGSAAAFSTGDNHITQVTVNSSPASFDPGTGTWTLANFPLALGSNVIRATATDSGGRETTAQITVVRDSVNQGPVAVDDVYRVNEADPEFNIKLPFQFSAARYLSGSPFNSIIGMVAGDDGKLYVSDSSGAIIAIDLSTGSTTTVTTLPFARPRNMIVGDASFGNSLIVSDHNSQPFSDCCTGQVLKIDKVTGQVTVLSDGNPSYPGFADPFGLAFSSGGNFPAGAYVMDFEGSSPYPPNLFRIAGDGTRSPFLTNPSIWTTERFPTYLVFGPGGDFGNDLFVADSLGLATPPMIWRVNAQGAITSFVAGEPLRAPGIMRFGRGGVFGTDLYVLDNQSKSIFRITAGGTISLFARDLPLTEGLSSMEFSPDGQSLFVGAGNKLIRITSPPSLLVNAPGVLANDTDNENDPLTAALVSGPSQGTVTLNPNGSFNYSAGAGFTGTDTFTYKASDGTQNSNIATVTIHNTVNQAPVINAGPDQTIGISSAANLNGTVSDDGLPSGTLATGWSRISGPAAVGFGDPAQAVTSASFSAVGTYVLRLTANDGELTIADDITIVVTPQNNAPAVNAGIDQVVTLPGTINLDGSASDDDLPQGSSLSVSWTKVSGAGDVTFANPGSTDTSACFTASGIYVLRLTATDGQLTASDDVTVTIRTLNTQIVMSGNGEIGQVDPYLEVTRNNGQTYQPVYIVEKYDSSIFAPGTNFIWGQIPGTKWVNFVNSHWMAGQYNYNAGVFTARYRTTFTLPADYTAPSMKGLVEVDNIATVFLNGTQVGYHNSYVDPPGTFFTNNASLFQAGVNVIEIDFMDTGGGVGGLDFKFLISSVNSGSQSNQPPIVSAGADQTIYPPSVTSLGGAVIDDYLPSCGSNLTISWTKVSGPGNAVFANPNSAATTVTFSSLGTYVLRLTGSDGVSTVTDDVTITALAENQPPTVSAGQDREVRLPDTINLSGTVTDDGIPPPAQLSLTWSKVSGPGSVTFTNPTSLQTTATFGENGTYVLRLTASDSALSSSDETMVTVYPETAACPSDDFVDDFNDNLFDTQKWSIANPASPMVVSEQNQRLKIALAPNTAEYNSIASNQGFNLTNRSFSVEVVDPGSQAGWISTFIFLEQDANNSYRMSAGAGSAVYEIVTGGVSTQRRVTSYNYQPFWRIRHDSFTNQVRFESSTNGQTWTLQHTVTPTIPLDSLKIRMGTGAYGTGNSSPGQAVFDNVRLVSVHPNCLPATSIASPADNTSFAAGSNVEIQASASDSDGTISKVEFFQNGIKLGEKTPGPGITSLFIYDWIAPASGNYTLTVKATDNGGASAISAPVHIAVAEPVNQPPTVEAGEEQSIISPAVANLNGTATDDGLPSGSTLSVSWSKVSGPGNVVFSAPSSTATTAAFSTAGDYLLRLTATDSALTGYDEVHIIVQPNGLCYQGDNFNDDAIDPTKWLVPLPNTQVYERNQRLEIVPFTPPYQRPDGSLFYNGYYSAATCDFTGVVSSVEIVQATPPEYGVETDFRWTADDLLHQNANTFGIATGGGNLALYSDTDGVRTRTILNFDPVAHRFWRISHYPATDEIVWETSSDNISWTIQRRIPRPFPIDSIRVALDAGTYLNIGNTGTAIYDNFNIRRQGDTGGGTNEAPAVYAGIDQTTGMETGNQAAIYTMNADGTNVTRLTYSSGDEQTGQWSPDGTKILFSSKRNGANDIYSMNSDGSGQTRLTSNPAEDISPYWSPDGTKIYFASARTGNFDIYSMNPDGSNVVQLTNNSDIEYRPNPRPQAPGVNGDKIAFFRYQPGNLNSAEIWTMNLDGTDQQKLTNNSVIDDVPVWSPDGSKMAFVSTRDGNLESYIMNANGTNVQRISNHPAEDWVNDWSLDGKSITYTSNRTGDYEVYTYRVADGVLSRLTYNPAIDYAIFWSPTANKIAFASNRQGVYLQGTATDDGNPAGSSVTVNWTKVSGPGTVTFSTPNSAATNARFSQAGTYVLKLTGTDGQASGFDEVTVEVEPLPENQAPTVNAGADKTVPTLNNVELNGVVGDDGLPLMSSVNQLWSVVSGPGSVTFSSPNSAITTANFSVAGTYALRLTATDSQYPAFDEVSVTVQQQNQPPQVSAGADQSVTLPGTAALAGTASDDGLPAGSSLSVTWSKISGSGNVIFTDPNAAATTASFTTAGTYVLRLTATDSLLTVFDEVTVTVQALQNQAPQVSAGADQTITLPAAAALSGTASDDGLPQGSTLSLTWSKVSGAGDVIFSDSHSLSATAGFSVAGTYVLRLTASDGELSAADEVTVTVNAGQPQNQPPTADAGADRSVTLNSNLVRNPGAESDLIGGEAPDWTEAQGTTWTQAGVASGGPEPRFGRYYFNAGNEAQAELRQDIDLRAFSQGINDGTLQFTWKAYIRSLPEASPDGGTVIVEYRDAANQNTIASLNSGEITTTGAWHETEDTRVPPAGTGYMRIRLVAQRHTGTSNDVFFDGLSLRAEGPIAAVLLNGSATDDGLPSGSTLQSTWTKVSGPGVVSFGSAGTLDSPAAFTVAGAYVLRLTTTDGALNASDDVNITVNPANTAPVVSSGADQTITLPDAVQLNGSITDDGEPQGGVITSRWAKVSGPGIVTFGDTSVQSTTASFSTAGTYVLRLFAEDGELEAIDEVTITVNAQNNPVNQPPTVEAGNNQTIQLPVNSVALNGTVTDDGLPNNSLSITWTRTSGPGNVSFANPNSAQTSATFDAAGSYILRLTVSDGQYTSFDEVGIIVNAAAPQNQPPSVTISPDQSITLSQQAILEALTLTDDGLPTGAVYTYQWSKISGPGTVNFTNPTETATYATFSEIGVYVVRLTASDSELTGSDEATVTVTEDVPAPSVEILTPDDGISITEPTGITGTVTAGNWRLEYSLTDTDNLNNRSWTTAASGAGAASGTLGTLDTTLMLNGTYDVRLISDNNGQISSDIISVTVENNLKIGHFTVSFDDMNMPVAGIPIQITRTYDSRDKRKGDFGYGWTLGIKNLRLEKNAVLGLKWYQTRSATFIPNYCVEATRPHIVSVTTPDGKVQKFEAGLADTCQQASPITNGNLVFRPQPGAQGKLEVIGSNEVAVGGSVPGPVDLIGFDTSGIYDRTTYKYTAKDGTEFIIDQLGGLQSVKDTNNNTLTISSSGITHSSGTSISFTRDASGRITHVTDPAGVSNVYTYYAAGDLASFKDRENNTTTFTYEPTIAHHLKSIVDPLGRSALRNEYDASGRLLKHVDITGAEIVYTHDLPARAEIVRDRLGNETRLEYDSRGNVLKKRDALNHDTTYTYDANDNLLTETNALGKTITYTYDAQDNKTSATDPLGNRTEFTYNLQGKVLTTKDARNNTTTNTYDTAGNLLTTTDARGNVKSIFYNAFTGQVASTRDALNHSTSFEYFGNYVKKQTDAQGNETTFAYDANANPNLQTVKRTNAQGQIETVTTALEYDNLNRVIKTTLANGIFTRTEYNELGQKKAAVNQAGDRTEFEYDTLGRLIKTLFPDGKFEESTYDAESRRLTSKDRANGVTTYQYDGVGRLKKTTYPDGKFTLTNYDPAGQVLSVTDTGGHTTSYLYDDAGRRIQTRNALDQITESTFDANGNQLTVKDALNHTTTYVYDELDRREKTIFADGTYTQTTFDALGRITAERDQAGKVTQFFYDSLSRMTKVTDAINQETRYEYNEIGQQVKQIDALNRETRIEYDKVGRRTKRILPLGQTETYSYSSGGDLESGTDFNGKTTTFTYDNMHRLLSKTPDASLNQPAVSFTYNDLGQRATMNDASGTTTYGYDTHNRLASRQTPFGTLSYTYNETGSIKTLRSSNANGVSVDYDYDELNRLDTVKDNRLAGNQETSYTYDAVGNLQSYSYPNQVTTSYAYNNLNRLTTMTLSSSSGGLASYQYTLGAAGNRTQAVENGSRTVNYVYDDLYRLTQETIAGSVTSGNLNYGYDAVGNRLSRTSTLSPVPNQTSTFDANDRLESDTYDANGNTKISNGKSYNYDFENHLTSTSDGVTVVYDGDGNRVSKTVGGLTTNYLVDTNNLTGYAQVVEEIQGGSVTKAYTYGHDLISQRVVGGNVSFYGYDGHGSVRNLTDSGAQITDTYTYDAFGNLIESTGSTSNNYLFAGEQFDADLGFYYNRARYLNVQTGRFISRDSFEGSQFDPETLHKYTYCENDGVNRLDPSGNFSVIEMSIVNSIQTILVNTIANIGFAVADQIRFGGDVGLESIAIGALATFGIGIAARRLLPRISSKIASWIRGTSKEKFFFRGTSMGWEGGDNALRTVTTPTSLNPAKSHIFAANAATKGGGEGVIYVASNIDMQGITIGSGNVLDALEREIVFDILPTQFAQRASKTVTLEQSQAALRKLGIEVPLRFPGNVNITPKLEEMPFMTDDQIREYVRLIGEL